MVLCRTQGFFYKFLIVATRPRSWNGCGPRAGCAAGRKYPAVGSVQSMAVFFFCYALLRQARLALLRSYQRLAPPAISTFISRIGARWTRRSTAATAVISSGKILPQFSNGWLAVMRSERRSYRTEMSSKSTLVSAWSLRTVVKSSRITR